MKIKLFAKLATISTVVLFSTGCQKSVLSDADGSGKTSTNPRSAKHPTYHHIGYGYDATGEYANQSAVRNSVINIATLDASLKGRYTTGSSEGQRYYEEYGENAEQYSRKLSQKVSASTGFPLFGGSIKGSYSSSNESSYSFDGKHVYGNYYLLIRKRHITLNAPNETLQEHLSPQFKLDIANQSPQYIVQTYGTHIMKDIYVGGKFNILYQAETRNTNRTIAARSGIKISANFIFNAEVEEASSVDVSEASQNFQKRLVYYTEGGNSSVGMRGQINLDTSTPTINTTNWQNSVTAENGELIDFGTHGLIPIYDLIANPSKRQQVKAYVDQYLLANYVKTVYKRVPVYSLYLDGWHHYRNHRWSNHVLSINTAVEDPKFINEGIAFFAYEYQRPGTVPVYRYRSEQLQDNFFTTEQKTYQGYAYQGVAFYAYQSSTTTNGYALKPVYRYWSSNAHWDHYFTTENRNFVNYTQEGIEFYAPTTSN